MKSRMTAFLAMAAKVVMMDNRPTISEVQRARSDKTMSAVGRAASFYRMNPHRFVEDYFDGISLRLFQKILLYMMNLMNYFILFSSRGLGKTFLIAIFCCVRCILYPGTKIVIASSTRAQGNLVLEKIKNEIAKKSKNVAYEIEGGIEKGISISANKGECYWKNGSVIKVVTMSDNARGNRGNILFVDEFAQTDKNVIDTVLKKFLSAEREPEYLHKPEYANYPKERNKQLYASSAWMKSHWSYEKLKVYVSQMCGAVDRKYFACCLPYQIAIKENLLSRGSVEDEMSEDDFNPITWMMEMECIFYGDTEESFFRFDTLARQRKLKNSLPTLKSVLNGTEIPPKLSKGERRILSVDVALMASTRHKNDASSVMINCAIPNKNGGFASNYNFIDGWEGLTTDELGMNIMRVFYLYSCTDLVLDTNGIGTPVFDFIAQDHYDPVTGVFYGALTTLNPKDPMAERCKVRNANRCVWSIKANAEFNSQAATYLRNSFDTGKINLLVDEHEIEVYLMENNLKYKKMTSQERVDAKLSFFQTTLLIDELINLRTELNGTKVKLKERSGRRKDRYSSILYNNWVVETIARQERARRSTEGTGDDIQLLFKKPVIRKR